MSQKILITSALPYANGPIHFGHIAGAYLPGDVYARFQRLIGSEVLYICGSDEYGIAITLSAELANRSFKEHVDFFHEINKSIFKKLNFSFDHFSRTTAKIHTETTQEFFKQLYANGYIEEKVENHLYSEQEHKFLADRYVIGICPKCGFDKARGDECQKCGASYEAKDLIDPKSKISNAELCVKPSKHWYLRFDMFKDRLKNWMEGRSFKPNVKQFAMHYIDNRHERAITRDMSWGIPVPLKEAKDKVFYVWFDAPIGYISATKEWAQKQSDPEKWKEFWMNDKCKLIHFIGKDNIPFHTIFFPAMLMGQNESYILPENVPANEFLLLEGRSFSKSDNWSIDIEDFFKSYTTDQIRYYLASNAPETSDADFCWKDFQIKCNVDLLGKLGNFVHRVLTFTFQHCNGIVPQIVDAEFEDEEFLKKMDSSVEEAFLAFSDFKLRKVCQILIELAQAANAYFDLKKPWKLAKSKDLEKKLFNTIGCSIQCIKNLALIAYPIMPETANKIWHFLGFENTIDQESWHLVSQSMIPHKRALRVSKVLFSKIEEEQIEKEIQKLSHNKTFEKDYEKQKEMISFDQFQKLDLRVAKIIEAKKIEKSNRLLHLTVDLGFEKRTVISGIAKNFSPEQLIGKKVVVVANLKPAKIMGIQSEAMILAASFNDQLELPEIQHLEPGSIVT